MSERTTCGGGAGAPVPRQLAYVIYDFSIKRGIKDNLIAARRHFDSLSETAVRVEFPDASAPGGQGEIWSNIVRPKLHEASHVIAYVDKPNANVGFEIGYALGRGNRNPSIAPAIVALALHATQVPEWLKKPPFGGFNAVQFKDEQALIDTIKQRSGFDLREPVEPGTDLLFLCPDSGGKYLSSAINVGQWRTLNGSGWALKDLPKQLARVGGVVWMVPPTVDERDGPENTALSVVAGFAKACDIELRVLLHSEAREVLDILPEAQPVEDLDAFNELIRKTHDDLRRRIDEASRAATMPPEVKVVARPDIGDLPHLPHTAELVDRFIGRQRWLEDFYSALEGLRSRWMGSLTGDRNPVQLFWYHGLGGMGKTTLVRRAMLDTGVRYPQARVAYWEWDRDVWRRPLGRPPDSAEDVFVAIAYRLAQLYGAEALDPYWRVEARIRIAAPQASQAKARFQSEHNDWIVKAQASSALRAALDALGLLRSKKELSEGERTHLFRRWIDQGGFDLEDPEASLDGARLQHDALISCLTKLTQEAPLLMVFDTCEVLSADAEQALRSLLIEICDRRKAVLVLIASRLAPDVGILPGSKETWRDSLGDDRLKIERFDDLTLTTTEIEQYLQRFDPTLDKPGKLAAVLQRITLGVPLAIRVLVEADGGPKSLYHELKAWNGEVDRTAPSENALYELYEKLTDRFLLHVHEEEHLHAIIALAITTDANRDLLVSYWGGRNSWAERIRQLGRRYSLLSGGELHPVVRGHLRRSLRAGKYSEETRVIAKALSETAAHATATSSFDGRYFQQQLGKINLDTWTNPNPSTLDIAPGIAMAMAYEQRLDSWFLLAAELAEVSQESPGRGFLLELQHLIGVAGRNLSYRDFLPRYRWMNTLSAAQLEGYFDWLDLAKKQVTWSKEEETALRVIGALNVRDAPDALLRFADAIEHSMPDGIPLVSQLGEALFELARVAWRKSPVSADIEKSLVLALRINYQASSAHAALGDFFQRNKRFEQAHENYVAASNLEPENAALLVNLADLFRLQKQFATALDWVSKALTIDANSSWSHNQIGIIESDQKHYERAIAAFEKAHELDATEPAFANNLADTYRRQQQHGKAAEWVDKALAIDAADASAHNQRGLIEKDLKHYDQAIAAFERAHERDATEPIFANNLADIYRLRKQHGKAAEWVDKALAIDARYGSAHNQRGLIERDLEHYDQAIAAFERAHELDATEPVFAYNLADIYRLQKQHGKAVEWVDRTLAIDAAYAWAHNQRGLIERDLRHYDQAIAAFERAHELDATEPAFAYNLADIYRVQKQHGKAAEWVDKTLAIDAAYALAHNQRGLIERDLKHYDQAIAAFERAHERDATEPVFANNLADTYRLQKQHGKAAEWVDKALAIDATYASAHNQRGLIERDLEHYDQAIAAFERAHELDATEPVFAYNLADIYRLQKQHGKAAEWVDKALAIDAAYAWAHNQRGLIEKDLEHYDQAIGAFERAHELDATEPAFAYNLADTYRLRKQHGKAAEWVDKALAIDAAYALAHNQRGLIEKDLKHYDQAIGALERAHELDATEPVFAYNLADIYRLQKQHGKAVEWVDKALAIDAAYALAHSQRGLIERDLEHYDQALAAFERAHELDATEPVFAYNLANIYRLQKQHGKAIEWVDRTLAIDATYAWAHNQRGLVERDLEHYDQAIGAFERAHELDATEPAFAYNLADIYRLQKQHGKAAEWVDRTLAIDATYASAHNQRGLIETDVKHYDQAIAAFERAHELDATEPVFAYNLADIYRLQKQHGKAAEWVDKTLAIDPAYALAHNQRGLIETDLKHHDQALAAFERAYELDPREPEFSYDVGWCLLEQLKFDDSEQWARKSLELNSSHTAAQNLLGAIAFAQRRWSEAAQIFRRVAAVDPFESVLPCNAARAHMRMGQFTQADELLATALRINPDVPSAYKLLALLRHLTDSPEAAQLAERARELEQDFESLIVFAITRPSTAAAIGPDDALQAFKQALDIASPLDRELNLDLVIYALSLLESMHGALAQEATLRNASPVWESFREAIAHRNSFADPPHEPRVAAIVAALRSPLTPKERLVTSWASEVPTMR